MATTLAPRSAAYSTGIKVLDDRTGGFLSGETVYLVGGTGQGKTTTLMTVLYNLTRESGVKGYGLFTELAEGEEAREEVVGESELDTKFGCALAGVEWRTYQNTKAEWCSPALSRLTLMMEAHADKHIAIAKQWREDHLVLAKQSHPTSGQVSAALDMCAKRGLAFLVIDHIGLVSWEEEPEQNTLKKQEAGFERLVMKARRLGILLIVVGQMGKAANAAGTQASLAAIRGAHGNAAAAWTVVSVAAHYLPAKKGGAPLLVPGVIEFKVLKNRIGGGSPKTALARVSFGRVRDLNGQRELSELWNAARNGRSVVPQKEAELEPTPF